MSLLLLSESSTARFSVSTAGVVLTAGAAASCAAPRVAPLVISKIPIAILRFQAIPLPPITPHTSLLLVPQRLDRFQNRRLLRRQPAKKQSGRAGHQECQYHAHS